MDARYFKGNGVKEITKESYDWIIEEDKRIVSNRSEKDKKLIAEYLPKDFKNAWHRPFFVND